MQYSIYLGIYSIYTRKILRFYVAEEATLPPRNYVLMNLYGFIIPFCAIVSGSKSINFVDGFGDGYIPDQSSSSTLS